MKYISIFSPNAGKYGPEKTPYLDTFQVMPVYLVDELALVFYSPFMIELMVDLLTIFTYVIIVLVLWGLVLFCEMGMGFKDKIMLHCFREVKCQQGFTTEIWY